MRLLLTVTGVGDRAFDVDPAATVGELVDAVSGSPGKTFEVARTGLRLAREQKVEASDIRSADVVDLVMDTGGYTGIGRAMAAAATLRVVDGPNRGAEYPLRFGVNTVGRGEQNDVTLKDSLASRTHAQVHVGDMITIADAGSTNGVVLGNDPITQPTLLHGGTRALIGDSWIEVEHHNRTPDLDDMVGNSVDFNRPPRISQPYRGTKAVIPAPPNEPRKQRLPMIAAIAPLLMAVFYFGIWYLTSPDTDPDLVGKQRTNPPWMILGFVFMSPVMMIGSQIERRRSGRIEYEEAVEEFRENVAHQLFTLDAESETEHRSRLIEAPRADEIPGFVRELSPRLWERGPDDTDVLTVRLGRADQPSRITVELKDGGSKELRREISDIPERYEIAKDVPVLVNIVEAGGLGVSGLPDDSVPIALSVISQIAGLHSPSELLIAAMVGDNTRANWAWMKWLPHAHVENSPLDGPHLASTADTCHDLLSRLDALIEERLAELQSRDGSHRIVMPAIVVVIDESMPIERHRLVRLLEHGPRAGVFFVWVATSRHRLPRPVGAYIDVPRDGSPVVGYTTSDEVIEPVALEPVDIRTAATVARALAPVRDVSGRFASASQVPARVNLVDLLDGPQMLVDPALALQRWNQESRSLRAPVGAMAGAPFSLDIRHDGPHALVAGTTGAGKSELLQSWIASLALTYGPEKITFLLVDYKGGSAFKDINHLPHTVGMVTDLDTNGVRRALVSLNAELHHRERILAAANCSDLAEMEKKRIPGTPPSLLIVVDEFAALVQEVPEFVEGMVNVAQRGRSLGLHLILATQRPGGVITPQVRANTNLRIALRMADESESSDVVNSKIAADIERSLPGRGVARIGPKELISFQSAYVGGVTDPDGTVVTVEVSEFTMNGAVRLTGDLPQHESTGATDLENLVDIVNKAHSSTGRELPRKPWLNPLGAVYELGMLPRPDSDTAVVLGAIDLPDSQSQAPLLWHPDDEGSLGVLGASGSGKTTALQSIACAVAFSGEDPQPDVYAIDFSGRSLDRLDELPHVGAVLHDDDDEQIRRLLANLDRELDRRATLFGARSATSLPEYRRFSGDRMGRRFLLIDGFGAFHHAYDAAGSRPVEICQRLLREGRQYGLHLVVTLSRRSDIPSSWARSITGWMTLRQGSADEYRSLEVPTDVLHENSPPGRVLINRQEGQLAILGGSARGDVQTAAVSDFARQLRDRGAVDAARVEVLSTEIRPTAGAERAFLMRDTDLSLQGPPSLGFLLIAGPRASGRTSALVRYGETVATHPGSVDLFSPGQPRIRVPAGWRVWSDDGDEAQARLTELAQSAPEGSLVLLDDVNKLAESRLATVLGPVIRGAGRGAFAVAAAIENVEARSEYRELNRDLRSHRSTLLLRPDTAADSEIAGVPLPKARTSAWPAGRGFLVLGSGVELVQIVHPASG